MQNRGAQTVEILDLNDSLAPHKHFIIPCKTQTSLRSQKLPLKTEPAAGQQVNNNTLGEHMELLRQRQINM